MNASAGFLDSLPIVLVFVGTVIFIIAFFEVGFRFGRYSQSRNSKGGDGSLGPMVGSTLAMLAFVLAITFSMAASRYDQRNQNLLDEVRIQQNERSGQIGERQLDDVASVPGHVAKEAQGIAGERDHVAKQR